jgi:hypothetical protein
MLPQYGNTASIFKLEEPLGYAWPINLQQPTPLASKNNSEE